MSSNRKKILWLASWYPNKFDHFDGDFIQRHARAASIHNDIHVIAVKEGAIQNDVEEEWNYATGLTEQVVYFRTEDGLFHKLKKQLKWRKLFLKAVKKYIHEHGRPAIVHVHVPWKAGVIAINIKRKYGLSYIITEHWDIYNNVLNENFNTLPFYIKVTLKQIFKKASLLITPSNFLGVAINNIVTHINFTVIPNVVNTSIFYLGNDKHESFTFIHVSNMASKKNTEGILKAYYKFRNENRFINTRLILIGNRNNKYMLLAESLGLLDKNVIFKGELPYEEVAMEMQKAHCLILNSFMENSPCVIGEALCCGLPVITTKVGGIAELVDSTNGLFIDVNNEQGLADAMVWMQQNYHTFDQKAIAEKAAKNFGEDTALSLHDQVYSRF